MLIHAGELPTLRNEACSGSKDRNLIQIDPQQQGAAAGYNLMPSRDAAKREA